MGKKMKATALFLALLLLLSSCGGEKTAETAFDPVSAGNKGTEIETGNVIKVEYETETEETFVRVEIDEPSGMVPSAPEKDDIPEDDPTEILKRVAVKTGSGNIKLKVRTDLDPTKPMVALTFDDGPSKYTNDILDLLEKYNGRGSFCVVGNRLDKYTAELNRMAEGGHEIVSHTWSHTNLKNVGEAEGKKAMRSVIDYVYDLNGYQIRFVRPPYGGFNDTVKKEAADLGVALLRWSVDTLDWKTKNPASTLKEVKKSTGNGSIILVHDIHGETAEAMKDVIPWLAGEGYQLVTVSELLYYQNDGATAGKVYYNT